MEVWKAVVDVPCDL